MRVYLPCRLESPIFFRKRRRKRKGKERKGKGRGRE
jgi:hypothetical protein